MFSPNSESKRSKASPKIVGWHERTFPFQCLSSSSPLLFSPLLLRAAKKVPPSPPRPHFFPVKVLITGYPPLSFFLLLLRLYRRPKTILLYSLLSCSFCHRIYFAKNCFPSPVCEKNNSRSLRNTTILESPLCLFRGVIVHDRAVFPRLLLFLVEKKVFSAPSPSLLPVLCIRGYTILPPPMHCTTTVSIKAWLHRRLQISAEEWSFPVSFIFSFLLFLGLHPLLPTDSRPLPPFPMSTVSRAPLYLGHSPKPGGGGGGQGGFWVGEGLFS